MDLARLSRTITFLAFAAFVITLVGVFLYTIATGQSFTKLVIYEVEVGVAGFFAVLFLAAISVHLKRV